jgi:hypothetical protein
LRIANAIYEFWTVRDYADEGLEWFDRLISQAGDETPLTVRTNAVAHAGLMAGFGTVAMALSALGIFGVVALLWKELAVFMRSFRMKRKLAPAFSVWEPCCHEI